LKGRTLTEAEREIHTELKNREAELDSAATLLVEAGLAEWSGDAPGRGRALIIRGRANLLEDAQAAEDLDRVRQLFEAMERQQSLLDVLDAASGSSVIVAPYMSAKRQVIGALGVIGPTRLNYARVIPMVDYTAKVVGEIAGKRTQD